MQPDPSSVEPSIPVTFDEEPSIPKVPSLDLPSVPTQPATQIETKQSLPQSSVTLDLSSPSSQELPSSTSVPQKTFHFEEDPVKREETWQQKINKSEPSPNTLPSSMVQSPQQQEQARKKRPAMITPARKITPENKPKEKKPKNKNAESELDSIIIKMNHIRFQKELEKAATAGKDPYFLAAMMLKYSEMIDEVDPQKSLELLSIAEGILNG